jgi:hypothetical protein
LIAALFRSGLVLIVAGVGFVALRSMVDSIDVSPVTAPDIDAASEELETPASRVAIPPLADMAETRERPLFSAQRRSAPAQVVEADTVDPQGYANARALIRTAGAPTG